MLPERLVRINYLIFRRQTSFIMQKVSHFSSYTSRLISAYGFFHVIDTNFALKSLLTDVSYLRNRVGSFLGFCPGPYGRSAARKCNSQPWWCQESASVMLWRDGFRSPSGYLSITVWNEVAIFWWEVVLAQIAAILFDELTIIPVAIAGASFEEKNIGSSSKGPHAVTKETWVKRCW